MARLGYPAAAVPDLPEDAPMRRTFEYAALRTMQVRGGKPLVLFSAPGLEIDVWAGIPQKKGDEGQEETVGFQRDEDLDRVAALAKFLKNPSNVVQNPLLCARRDTTIGSISFEPQVAPNAPPPDLEAPGSIPGKLLVQIDDLEDMPLLKLLEGVMQQIESRLPELKGITPDPSKVSAIVARLRAQTNEEPQAEDISDRTVDEEGESSNEDAMTALFTDETHVVDFWNELAARAAAIPQLSGFDGKQREAAGFTREALSAFLKPLVVVDGQHRLRGANADARDKLRNDELLKKEHERLVGVVSKAEAAAVVSRMADRQIPISLVWSTEPAEHVFQFVVVNQKATPIHKALLGTILSTTLTKNETDQVRTRLEDAGIKLQQAQGVAFVSREISSPFYGKVETGLAGEGGGRLAWTVMQSLIHIFQDLKGGNLYHQSTGDWADYWRKKQLDGSGIVAGWQAHGSKKPFDFWRRPDGPWRDIFIAFYDRIREFFSNTTDEDARNYWGDPKVSNLFNKISLTILAADFFQYLYDTKQGIDSVDHLKGLMNEWLEDVKPDYFTGDWPLEGKKKDSPGIRKRWSLNWEAYRKSPTKSLPPKKSFGQPL